MDPAALGTALIGLEAIRSQSDDAPHRPGRRRPERRPRLVGLRAALAGTLRTLADALEPRPREGAAG